MNYLKALFLIAMILVLGCSKDIPISKSFSLAEGSEIEIQRELNTYHPDKELIFDLIEIPESKKDRDFSDFISVLLIDASGKQYMPEKITDINGNKQDIIASFNNIPNGTKIETIKIRALKNLKGTSIRWWSGKLL
jgi:hypothetical protein